MTERRDEDPGGHDWRAIAGWFLVAAALRLLYLGHFSLWGDEVYSLDDALRLFTPEMTAGKLAFPLFYLIERGVLELAGIAHDPTPDPRQLQWALRIVPALAGAVAAAVAFAGARGFLNRRERHLFAAFIAFSPWLLFFSQTARGYTLVVALAIPATFELLRAVRDASFGRGVRGALWLLLATLVHPIALLLLVGHVAAAFVAAMVRVRPLNRGLVPPLLLPVVLAIPALIWPATTDPLLHRWTVQDAGVEGATSLLLGIGWNVGPLISAIAFLGMPSLWRRDRLLALHVGVGVGVPIAALLALALAGKSIDQRYLLALLPLAFVPAAVFANELAGSAKDRAGAPRFAVPLLVLLPWLPSIVSESIDGNRHDLAGAAKVVCDQLEPGDGVIAETHALMRRLLPADLPEARLLEAPPETGGEWQQFRDMWAACRRLWIVIPAEWDEGNAIHRSFAQWAWLEGRLVRELWRPRLDYHQNRLRIFLVEPKGAERWQRDWRPK